jgi:hypothetical protein
VSVTADDILAALKERCGEHNIWASELAFTGGARRCDFWTVHCHASKGFEATAYEIKVSRADFRRDSSVKQREARLYSDRFFYVTPPGLVGVNDVPDWAGLIELDGSALRTKIQAPFRDKDSPSWELVVSLIRNSGEVRRDLDVRLKHYGWMERQLKLANEEKRRLENEVWKLRLDHKMLMTEGDGQLVQPSVASQCAAPIWDAAGPCARTGDAEPLPERRVGPSSTEGDGQLGRCGKRLE